MKQPATSQPRTSMQANPSSSTTRSQPQQQQRSDYQPSYRPSNPASARPSEAVPYNESRTDVRPSTTISPSPVPNYPPRPNMTTYPSNQAKAPAEVESIRWYTLQEALELSKSSGKRKLFIDVYTTWCGWCKRLDETTFVDPAVARYINKHYYAVKFDAEQTNDIVFKDKTYKFKRNGNRGHHELAAEWLNNRLSYPTMVFLDENLNTIQSIPGYQEARKLEAILNYFGTDSHKTTPWETYERKFVSQQ